MNGHLHALMEKSQRAAVYFRVRGQYEHIPARVAFGWACGEGEGQSLVEYLCSVTRGHEWGYSGTQYGGDDERWHGEGRCLCVWCGADGDA